MKTKKERNKPVTILRPAVTELETDGDRDWGRRWVTEVKTWVESVSESEWRGRRGWVCEWERERRVRLWGKWVGAKVWNMRGGRVFLVYIYTYIYGVLGNFIFKWVGFGSRWQNLNPTQTLFGFFFKDPYLTLLFIRSGQTRFPRVGILLPSLFLKGH